MSAIPVTRISLVFSIFGEGKEIIPLSALISCESESAFRNGEMGLMSGGGGKVGCEGGQEGAQSFLGMFGLRTAFSRGNEGKERKEMMRCG